MPDRTKKDPEKKERTRPRWEDEEWILEKPNPLQCRNCQWRAPDRKIGSTTIKGYTLGLCQVMDVKPHEVIWKGEPCPYRLAEKKGN